MPVSLALFISHLPENELKHLSAVLRPWRERKGVTVHPEGGVVRALYMIDSGSVRFELNTPDGRTVVLGFSGAGRSFGELEVIEKNPALAAAVVNQSATGWQLDVDDFHAVLPQTPVFAQLMLRTTARNARIHHMLYRHSLLMTPEARLALTLLSMARHHASPTDAAGDLIEVTQDMLAQLVGSTRQCVSKHLRQWDQNGWVAIQYGGIRLIQHEAIAALVPAR
ncbi:MAG: Crp/Fnr family transcriptional regulator [Aquabacterium sp.]|nr:Crp/Fnr family transcriptional regulator [Aquabacterium sp.]